MVSALDSGSRGPGSSPGRVIVLCSWARHFTLTVPLSTQEYKWVLHATETGISSGCVGHLARVQTFLFYLLFSNNLLVATIFNPGYRAKEV